MPRSRPGGGGLTYTCAVEKTSSVSFEASVLRQVSDTVPCRAGGGRMSRK
jgi:hypothetical protein